ncbi:transporter [Panacagrimonas perspica]|uniref:transporter n=1 Tax=Panacagrimonas perspica TaxID=381431 RepID=UPI00105BD425
MQVEDDRPSGRVIEDRRTRKFAIGPKLGYWPSPTVAVYAQIQKEYDVRNAPRGEYY